MTEGIFERNFINLLIANNSRKDMIVIFGQMQFHKLYKNIYSEKN